MILTEIFWIDTTFTFCPSLIPTVTNTLTRITECGERPVQTLEDCITTTDASASTRTGIGPSDGEEKEPVKIRAMRLTEEKRRSVSQKQRL